MEVVKTPTAVRNLVIQTSIGKAGIISSDAMSLAELKKAIVNADMNISYDSFDTLKVMIGETKNTLEIDDAVLPPLLKLNGAPNHLTIFLLPTKSKGGISKKKSADGEEVPAKKVAAKKVPAKKIAAKKIAVKAVTVKKVAVKKATLALPETTETAPATKKVASPKAKTAVVETQETLLASLIEIVNKLDDKRYAIAVNALSTPVTETEFKIDSEDLARQRTELLKNFNTDHKGNILTPRR